jgi:PHD/YefM family antitoxin component YafN of YafNO toxin-antitoxin module
MSITTVSSRAFARDLAHAKQATGNGPVIVTDRGRPSYALLKIEDFYALSQTASASLLSVMDAIPGGDFDFEPPRLNDDELKIVEFTA